VKSLGRILVPLDYSQGSDEIVEYACAVASASGAAVTLMHVYEPPNAIVAVVAGATVAGEAEAERKAGLALLDRAAALLFANGVTRSDCVVERATSAAEAIARHARIGRFELIVMGTHARRGVSRALLGSVAEDVVKRVACPVLLVHLPYE
jgi:nucleotide-binding universal stress UspA family protein